MIWNSKIFHGTKKPLTQLLRRGNKTQMLPANFVGVNRRISHEWNKLEAINFYQYILDYQYRSQNLKQVPQKAFNVGSFTLTSQLIISYWKIMIVGKKTKNYRVTFPSNHCCQTSFIVRERPGSSIIKNLFSF